MPHIVNAAIAASVRAELARAGISARQLAEALGQNRGWAHRRLARKDPAPFTAADLARIADYLDIPLSRLIEQPTSKAS